MSYIKNCFTVQSWLFKPAESLVYVVTVASGVPRTPPIIPLAFINCTKFLLLSIKCTNRIKKRVGMNICYRIGSFLQVLVEINIIWFDDIYVVSAHHLCEFWKDFWCSWTLEIEVKLRSGRVSSLPITIRTVLNKTKRQTKRAK